MTVKDEYPDGAWVPMTPEEAMRMPVPRRSHFAPGDTVRIVGIQHNGRIDYVKFISHRDSPIYGVSYWWNGAICNVELNPDEIAAKEDR